MSGKFFQHHAVRDIEQSQRVVGETGKHLTSIGIAADCRDIGTQGLNL